MKKICLNSRHGLWPFLASHARTSHVQISVRTHTCAHLHFMMVAHRTRMRTFFAQNQVYRTLSLKKKRWKYGSYKKHFCLKYTISELWLFCSKVRKISLFCLKSGQNVWSHVCGVWSGQKCPRAHTSHTCFKSLFARTRTRATAHRTCACAHAPSQPMPW